jgi:hypothetical protein
MKKEYINPELEVVKIEQQQMLCNSALSLDDTDMSLIGDDSKQITNEDDVW